MYRSNAGVWSEEQWQTGSSRQGALLGSTITAVFLFVSFFQSGPNHEVVTTPKMVYVHVEETITWSLVFAKCASSNILQPKHSLPKIVEKVW